MKTYKPAKNFVWIQGRSGEGYLCDVKDIEGHEKLSEEDLRKHCIADSDRPWND